MSEDFVGAIEIARVDSGMISIRGSFEDPAFREGVEGALGVGIPTVRKVASGDATLAWMAHDELLAVVPYGEAAQRSAALTTALAGLHALVVDVSDARAVFSLTGEGWREVLAKGAPVDLHPSAFGPGDIRRTRLGQVPAAFWCVSERQAELICFRSVSEFVHTWLKTAAQPGTLPGILKG